MDRSFSAYQDREERLDDFDTKWAEIRDNITGQDLGNYDLDNYFHHYLIAFEFKTLQFNQIFTHFLKLLERANPDEIITQLQNWSRNFVQIRNPKEKFDRNPRIEHYLTKIKNIKSTYLYPVVISGFKNYWQKGDKKSFERLVEICFKYHIRVKSLGIGVVLSSYQQKLYNVADRINSGESVDEIIDVLIRDESTYPSDLKLTPQLDTIKFTNSNLAIALLEELENEENPQYVSPTNVSLEHIMPKNISHWNEYIAKKHNLTESNQITALHAKYCNYLGNMALLSDPSNIRSKNKPFEDKKLFYEREGFHITKNVGKEQDWTTKEIEERQKKFTKKLLEILNIEKCKLV